MPASDNWQTEIATLQAGLGNGIAMIRGADGKQLQYRTTADIRNALTYFQDLAAKANPQPTPASRTTYATFTPVF